MSDPTATHRNLNLSPIRRTSSATGNEWATNRTRSARAQKWAVVAALLGSKDKLATLSENAKRNPHALAAHNSVLQAEELAGNLSGLRYGVKLLHLRDVLQRAAPITDEMRATWAALQSNAPQPAQGAAA